MTGIFLNDSAYEQDIRELLMAFYPGEAFTHQQGEDVFAAVEGSVSQDGTRFCLRLVCPEQTAALVRTDELEPQVRAEYLASCESPEFPVNYEDRFDTKNKIKRRLYVLLMAATGKTLPWGTLTGIRPAKIALTKLDQGETPEDIARYMKETYFTSDEKIALSIEIARRERQLLSSIDYRNGFSLYVGIPFCPTTCLYCSFTSYPIGKWQGRTGEYLNALYQELDYVAAKKKGCALDTVYFGGGTPTSLSPEDLDALITRVKAVFDFSTVKEFTVEAGRPDSITMEKLRVLKRHGVTRISINPQTMNQETLKLIGRRHTVEDVREKFFMAREAGFDNINMDLIIGLPGEDEDNVRVTMEAVRELAPDSVTVHSLAIKRAARLNTMKEAYRDYRISGTQEMIDLTAACAREMGLEPYYLYRQKNMAGNFENVGYAAPGKACIYNVLIMEERQTIIGCGAGTTTKRLFPEENRIERAENVKDVEQYISRIEEMIGRKERLL
ncbi:MAG: coproporphyrinogen dehydrogenase HemZ [Eubacteriales bacterium]|nr:coproporphyrinogen dehydrogenase HemZ [Eubacteriales bacterium]